MRVPKIGVLALQGCVDPHQAHIEALGCDFLACKNKEDLAQVSGLILPGGESTTMLRLIDLYQMEDDLKATFSRVPVWGICAGAILLARHVSNPEQKSFQWIDIDIERNAYGRQLQSFQSEVEGYAVSFIRAPQIAAIGKDVKTLAEHSGRPVWLCNDRAMVTTFHPELSRDFPSVMHRYFLEKFIRPKNFT